MGDIERIIAAARRDARCVGAGEVRQLCDEIERLRLYERAIESMARRIICPRMTAEEIARGELGEGKP